MLRFPLAAVLSFFAPFVGAAEDQSSHAADQLRSALQRLVEAPNYRWAHKLEDAGSEVFIVEGKAERNGFTVTQRRAFGTVTRAARKGSVTAVEKQDGNWETEAEVQAYLSKRYDRPASKPNYLTTPIDELTALLPHLANFTVVDGNLEAQIGSEAVTRRFPGMQTVRVAQARFWLTAGVLTKYELRFDVDFPFRGQTQRRDQKTSVMIDAVGITKVEVPAGAREKLKAIGPG